jgi:hypothetical protein
VENENNNVPQFDGCIIAQAGYVSRYNAVALFNPALAAIG